MRQQKGEDPVQHQEKCKRMMWVLPGTGEEEIREFLTR
jgi:hypothetical protein